MRSLESSRLRAMQHAARSGGATRGNPSLAAFPWWRDGSTCWSSAPTRTSTASGRTDTIMLVGFNPRTGDAGVLSIPRDTRVEIPGRPGFHRINVAYALGGPRLLMRTVEELLGVDVHHYVTINFSGFERFIDALGGVEVEIQRPMRYDDFAQGLHIDLPAGRQVLNGRQALHYVRYRADGLGDVSLVDPAREVYDGRVRRQLEFRGAGGPEGVELQFAAQAAAAGAGVFRHGAHRHLPRSSAGAGGLGTEFEQRPYPDGGAARHQRRHRRRQLLDARPGRTRLVVDRVIRGLEPATVEVLNGSGQSGATTAGRRLFAPLRV